MQNIDELITAQSFKPLLTKEDNLKIRDFVVSVFSLFTDYRGDFKNQEYILEQGKLWSSEICAMSPDEITMRLNKIKKLIAVPNTPKIMGNYRTPNSALAIACMPIEHLNHDYALAYPKTSTTGELKRIAESIETTTQHDIDVGKKTLTDLKGMFND